MLCLDIGNTDLYGGIFEKNHIIMNFRYPIKLALNTKKFENFIKESLSKENINMGDIQHISMCSVVPRLTEHMKKFCVSLFNIDPFELSVLKKLPINIKYKTPYQLGVDRIANAIGASTRYPNKSIIVVSLGTATTICAIDNKKQFLGGAILPGFKLSRDVLTEYTAKLPNVEIQKPNLVIGNTTESCIQSGLYYSQLGAIKEFIAKFQYHFTSKALIVGTGGFSHLFLNEPIFDKIIPELILEGLNSVYLYNEKVDT